MGSYPPCYRSGRHVEGGSYEWHCPSSSGSGCYEHRHRRRCRVCPGGAPLRGGNLTRSCTGGAFAPPAGGVCTETSWFCCAAPPAFAKAAKRIRDAELSACYTVASSRRACASLHKLRASGIARSGMAAAVIFWLALFKARGLSSPPSAMIRSQAMRSTP